LYKIFTDNAILRQIRKRQGNNNTRDAMGNYSSTKRPLHSVVTSLKSHDNSNNDSKATLSRPQRVANKVFLQNIAGMKNVSDEILTMITPLLEKRVYPAGTNVIKQNDIGDRFHFLYDGEVEYIQTVKSQGKYRKIHYGFGHPGAYFGEKALTTHKRRTMAVRAISHVTTLSLVKKDFTATLALCCAIFNSRGLVGTDKAYSGIRPINSSLNCSKNGKKILNRLEKGTILGEGTFGIVWSVRNIDTNEHYALKVIKKSHVTNGKMERYVKDEKLILAASNHPFIVQLHGTFSDLNYEFLLMDLCSKDNLATLLNRKQYFSENITKFYITGIIFALKYLHEQNIIFRDLKLENILVDIKGYPKLCDFGLAKKVSSGKTYTICGTFGYLSPELFLKSGYTKSCDLWSLGVCIYETIAGVKPFSDVPLNEVVDATAAYVKKHKMQNLTFYDGVFSSSLKMLLRKLFCDNPSKRIPIHGILQSNWYDRFNFDAYLSKKLNPPIPVTHLTLPKDVKPRKWNKFESDISWKRIKLSSYVFPVKPASKRIIQR
jgi:cGMP-dependent protein kinase 1